MKERDIIDKLWGKTNHLKYNEKLNHIGLFSFEQI